MGVRHGDLDGIAGRVGDKEPLHARSTVPGPCHGLVAMTFEKRPDAFNVIRAEGEVPSPRQFRVAEKLDKPIAEMKLQEGGSAGIVVADKARLPAQQSVERRRSGNVRRRYGDVAQSKR